MELVNLQISQAHGDAMVTGQFVRQGASHDETLIISVPERYYDMLSNSRDVFVPVLLLPCMKTGESLDLGGEVSGRLLDQIPEIQEIYLSWYPTLKPVEVIALRSNASPARASGTGAFFSAGADSFHTLHEAINGNIRGIGRLSHLVFVRSTAGREYRGFGRPALLDDTNDSSGLELELQQIAEATNTSLVRVDTNVQGLFTDFNWDLYHHGGSLASIALALSRGLGTQIISSGWSYRDIHPWGSHPFTDRLWSTDYLQFLHYGSHVTRAEKIAEKVASYDLALDHLRVCNYNSSITNCGRCYKCLRTMIPLDMVGKLAAAKTFPSMMPNDFSMALPHDGGSLEDESLYRLACKLGHDEYVKKIETIVNKRNRVRAVRQFLEASPALAPMVGPLRRARRLLKR